MQTNLDSCRSLVFVHELTFRQECLGLSNDCKCSILDKLFSDISPFCKCADCNAFFFYKRVAIAKFCGSSSSPKILDALSLKLYYS